MMAFCSLMRERGAWSLRESQRLAICDTHRACHTHALFLTPLFSLFLFLFCIFIHIRIRWDKDKQETSLRTEIGLCDRLSRSQWDTSNGFAMGSDTDDQFNELVTLLSFSWKESGAWNRPVLQTTVSKRCFTITHFHRHYNEHLTWGQKRVLSYFNGLWLGKKQYYSIALCISAGDFQWHNRLL